MPRVLPGIEIDQLERRTGHADIAVPTIDIPTDDAAAALAFCRQLSMLLEAAPHARAADGAVDLSHRELRPDVSVVIPVFNEEANLASLHTRLTATLGSLSLCYEIVFVDDGSRDSSLPFLRALAGDDQHVVVVELARNFG